MIPFTIDSGFVSGVNEIRIEVLNRAVGPMGLLISGMSGQATVPEPTSLALLALGTLGTRQPFAAARRSQDIASTPSIRLGRLMNRVTYSAVAAIFLSAVSCEAAIIVESRFDTSIEGWISVPAGGRVQHNSTGGNPGGFAQWQEPGIAQAQFLRAPAEYLGDCATPDGRADLSYDYRLILLVQS